MERGKEVASRVFVAGRWLGVALLLVGAALPLRAQQRGPLWPIEEREAFFRCASLEAEDARLACYDRLEGRWNLWREQLTLGAWETETTFSSADGSWSLRATIASEGEAMASGGRAPVRMAWTCENGSSSVEIESDRPAPPAPVLEWQADENEARRFEFTRTVGRLAAADPAALLDYVSGARRLRVVIPQADGGRREASFPVAPGVNALIDAMRSCGTNLESKTGGLRFLARPERYEDPHAIHRVEPKYPEIARKGANEGKVVLLLRVKVDGSVEVEKVVNAPVLERGLIEAATSAMSQWKYEPAKLDGAPIETVIAVFVHFTLDRR